MNKSLKFIASVAMFLSCHMAFAHSSARSIQPLDSCDTHTHMQFKSLKGRWRVQVVQLNEYGTFVKINDNCDPMQTSGYADDGVQAVRTVYAGNTVDESQSLTIGHELGENENFDTSAILSMVYLPFSDEEHQHPTKTCLLYIAAKGPAQPDYQVFSLNGAKCAQQNNIETKTVTLIAE